MFSRISFRRFCAIPSYVKGPQAEAPVVPIPIRNRKYLPGHWDQGLPEFLSAPRSDFPRVLVPESTGTYSIEDLAAVTRDLLEQDLHKDGAILFRNLPMKDYKEFSAFVDALGWRSTDSLSYLNAMNARSMTSTAVTDTVRTASDDPPEYTIEPHSEYHTVGCPPRIMLYCVTPPTHGGEWPVTDGRRVYKSLDPEVAKKFEDLGVKYKVFYESKEHTLYNCWETNIACTKERVEEYLEMMEYEWSWDEKNALSYWKTIPAVQPHPVTGEKCWFNQMHAHSTTFYKDAHPNFEHVPADYTRWPVESFYGDGSDIPDDVLAHVRRTVWENTVGVTLKKGDLLFCDNYLALHGRMGFKSGTPREVYVALSFD